MRGNPYGSLSSTVRLAPQGLLSFRYIDGFFQEIPPATIGRLVETKSRPG